MREFNGHETRYSPARIYAITFTPKAAGKEGACCSERERAASARACVERASSVQRGVERFRRVAQGRLPPDHPREFDRELAYAGRSEE